MKKLLIGILSLSCLAAAAFGMAACDDGKENNKPQDDHTHDLHAVPSDTGDCTTDGNKLYYVCDVCGKWYTSAGGTTEITDHDSVIIPAEGHKYPEKWNTDAKKHWYECTVCHEKKDEDGHTFTDGKCTVCDTEEFTEELTFSLDVNGASYCVTYQGVKTFTEVIIPSVYNGKPVTKINSNAFNRNTQLTVIKIPDSVTVIEYGAFSDCSSLTTVNLPDGLKTIENNLFYGCTSLEGVALPDGITSIGEQAFRECTSLKSIVLPDGVTEIGASAFERCTQMKSINIPQTVGTIGISAFAQCESLESVVLPDGVTNLGGFAFGNCKELKTLVIGKGVSSLEYGTLVGCGKLESLTLPFVGKCVKYETDTEQYPLGYIFSQSDFEGAERIRQTFYNTGTQYSSYEYYYIPTSLKYVKVTGGNILHGAFEGCKNIEEVSLPENITKICESAFSGCNSLKKVNIPDNVTVIESYAFSNCGLISVNIPDGVTEIGYSAFVACTALKSINIPDGVTSIPFSAFNTCEALTEVTIPDSVTEIGNHAFEGCLSLKSINIGNGVTSIGKNAFYNCRSLIAVNIKDIEAWCKIEFENRAYETYSANPLDYAHNLYVNGTLLTQLTIPQSITELGDWTFYGCHSLTSVTLPESVKSIGSNTFDYCIRLVEVYNLSSLILDNDSYWLNGYLGEKAIDIYTSKNASSKLHQTNDGYIFYENGALVYLIGYAGDKTELTLPDKFNGKNYAIYNNAFNYCKTIESVTIPYGVTVIGDYSFLNCYALKNVTIPDSVISIGNSAFGYCSSLKNIIIPDSVKQLGHSVFSNCSSLISATVGDGVNNISGSMFMDCETLENVILGKNVTSIDDYAFLNCPSLTAIIIPASVTVLGYGLFNEGLPEQVFYWGTEAEWDNLEKNGMFGSSSVYFYSKNEPTEDGNYWHRGENNQPEIWQ